MSRYLALVTLPSSSRSSMLDANYSFDSHSFIILLVLLSFTLLMFPFAVNALLFLGFWLRVYGKFHLGEKR